MYIVYTINNCFKACSYVDGTSYYERNGVILQSEGIVNRWVKLSTNRSNPSTDIKL